MTDTEIILVRHGQANSEAKTEEDYDRLSDLGHQQAKWLGEYFATLDRPFDHVITGTLRRHKETVAGIGSDLNPTIDARVNELRYFDMAAEMEATHKINAPQNPLEFAAHFPQTLSYWVDGELDNVHQPFVQFRNQFRAVIQESIQKGGRTLIVTSGGVIGTFIGDCLGINAKDSAKLILPIFNTSCHIFRDLGTTPVLQTYNATPHLDSKSRIGARTHV